ncbi:MAG: RNA polymerase sigma factor [Bacillota bacterium]
MKLEEAMHIPDEILATQTLNGDMDAFEELLNRHQKMVFKAAYRMMGQREEAEDIAQEVFVTVYSKMNQFDPRRKFSSWLYRITLNTCISRLRAKKNAIVCSFEESAFGPADSWQSKVNPLTVLEQKELNNYIWDALVRLPENYQIILILRYQMDFCNQEIANTLGIKKDNVEVRMHRARKALRHQLLKAGVSS